METNPLIQEDEREDEWARENKFLDVCEQIPYEKKGIFYSELWAFTRFCQDFGIQTIIESGTYHGFATRILLKAFNGPIVSIDRNEVAFSSSRFTNLLLLIGESEELIPIVVEKAKDKRIGILIDGPKGPPALALKDQCFKFPNVVLVAIHDLLPGNGESFHTHNSIYRQSFGGRLDRMIKDDYAKKYPNGPGLAIWTRAHA